MNFSSKSKNTYIVRIYKNARRMKNKYVPEQQRQQQQQTTSRIYRIGNCCFSIRKKHRVNDGQDGESNSNAYIGMDFRSIEHDWIFRNCASLFVQSHSRLKENANESKLGHACAHWSRHIIAAFEAGGKKLTPYSAPCRNFKLTEAIHQMDWSAIAGPYTRMNE